MNDAELILCLWENSVDRITKSCQIIVTSDENVRDTAVFQVWAYTCVKACWLIFWDSCSKNLLLTLHVDTEYRVHTFADDFIVFSGVENYPVEENYGVNFVERTVLPFIYLRKNFVGYSWNKSLRYFSTINLFEGIFDVTLRHSLSVHWSCQ